MAVIIIQGMAQAIQFKCVGILHKGAIIKRSQPSKQLLRTDQDKATFEYITIHDKPIPDKGYLSYTSVDVYINSPDICIYIQRHV